MRAIDLYIRTLSQRDAVTEAECEALRALPQQERSFAKGETIVREHSEPQESCLLSLGIAGREIVLPDGNRQITALHIPGDFVDLHGMLLRRMDHAVIALTECRCVFIPHAALRRVADHQRHLGRLLWLSTLIDAATQRTWTAAMAGLGAEELLAHMICELYLRFSIVGLAADQRIQIPLPQAVLADVLGLSAVHVNRVLQTLRRRGILAWKGGEVQIFDLAALMSLARFDDTYLSLVRMPR